MQIHSLYFLTNFHQKIHRIIGYFFISWILFTFQHVYMVNITISNIILVTREKLYVQYYVIYLYIILYKFGNSLWRDDTSVFTIYINLIILLN